MRKLIIVVITTLLATALAGADAAERVHRKHAASNHQKPAPTQPFERPVTRLPVSPDTFRA